jgi:protein-S-isoprenylcysteine O-methyltransferase Ste14
MEGKWFDLIIAAALPLAFLIQLLWSELVLAGRRIAMTGKPPVNPWLFFACKYLAIGAWGTVALQSLGIGWRPLAGFRVPPAISWTFWVFGFGLLFLGRINLSAHFRLGLPNEATRFQRNGIFRFTRNPMYAGIDVTMIATVLSTGNPALLAVAAFVITVQHRIILAEEPWLLATFGDDYVHYRERVGRYVTLPLAVRSWARAFGTFLTMGHCAPTFMSSLLRVCGRQKADWLVKLASALPGGIGNTGGECGGITSPLVLQGLLHGLSSVDGDLPVIFDRSYNHIEEFRCHRCTLLCREIRGGPNKIVPCIRAVVDTGAICAETLCGEARNVIPPTTREAYGRLYAAFDRCGFHCAQSVLRSFDSLLSAQPRLLAASSAFLGGTAFTGMTCSALTAGAMVLGLSTGEIERSPWRVLRMALLIMTGGPAFDDRINKFNRSMNRGGELAAWFATQFGSTQCRQITGADFSSTSSVETYLEGGGITRCRLIARKVAEHVQLMLGEDTSCTVNGLGVGPAFPLLVGDCGEDRDRPRSRGTATASCISPRPSRGTRPLSPRPDHKRRSRCSPGSGRASPRPQPLRG